MICANIWSNYYMIVYIKTTEQCNFDCLHCYNSKDNAIVDYTKLKIFLNQLTKYGMHTFVFHGGEPMLGNISDMLQLVEDFPDQKWRISTNFGYYISKEHQDILDRMIEIRVSFDVGIRFSSFKNLFRWYKNIKQFKNKEKLCLNICLSKFLIKHKPKELVDMIDKLGITRYNFERITNVGNAINNCEIIPSFEDIDNWLCELYEIEKNNECKCRCNDIQSVRLGIQKHIEQCYGKSCCTNALTINADGTIGNCPNDAKKNIIGSIDNSAIDVVKNIVSKKHIVKNECLLCNYFEYCKGNCEQIEWQDDMCPYPKQLANKLLEESIYEKNYSYTEN